MTMDRAVRNGPLAKAQKKRNGRIARIRSPGERPFAVVKDVFDGWYTRVKTLERVAIKEPFSSISPATCFVSGSFPA